MYRATTRTPALPVPLGEVCVVLAAVGLLMSGCKHGERDGGEAAGAQAPGAGAAASGLGRGVVVLEPDGKTLRVQVEVARTPAQRERGLMFRRNLGAHQGMLFIFERDAVQSFWMKNTYIPLDMIFIDDRLRVVGAVQNAAPLTLEQRQVDAPSRFVLEVNAGYVARHGIEPGTTVRLEGIAVP